MITLRQVDYDYLPELKKNRIWHNDGVVTTHFFNAMQSIFPDGEGFILDSVHDILDSLPDTKRLDPQLREDLDTFIKQEEQHTKEHKKWTRALIDAGYDRMEEYDDLGLRLRRWFRRSFSLKNRLSFTAGAEHYTGSIAYVLVFKKPELFIHAASPFKELLLYHAMEELEHKGVCIDLYNQLAGGYLRRILGFVLISIDISLLIYYRQKYLHIRDGLWDRSHRWEMMRFYLGKNGLLKALWPNIRAYFRPSFHPWQIDERENFERTFGSILSYVGLPPFVYKGNQRGKPARENNKKTTERA